MTSLWRISNYCSLDGLGGEKSDGRWHTAAPGKRIVHLSEHPAVALIETLVNLKGNPELFPEKYRLVQVKVEDAVYSSKVTLADDNGIVFRPGTSLARTRQEGDEWLSSNLSALAVVPSFPSPISMNFLLNPLHPAASGVTVEDCHWIKYDKRLFHIAEKTRRATA